MKQRHSKESIATEKVFDSFALGVLIIDCSGTILFSNRPYQQILGCTADELLGRKVWEFQASQTDKDKTQTAIAEILHTLPLPEPYLASCLRKDGTRVSLQFDWNYLYEEDGSLKGFVSVVTDLTKRFRRQERLTRANQGLTTLLSSSRNLVGALDLQKILQELVDGVSELMGMGSAAIYLIDGEMLQLAATFPPLPENFPESLRRAKKCDHPHLARAIDTRTPLFVDDILKEPLTPEEQAVVELRGLRTILYVPLIADEEVMGAYIVCSSGESVPVAASDIDLSCTLANLGALALKNARLFEEKQTYSARLEQLIAEQKATEQEREKLQLELFQIQKLDAIGQLAGGVAHDFNNQLGGILGYAELIRLKSQDDRLGQYAENIITLGRRSADLTAQLLAFSRKGQFQCLPVDLHQVIREVASILAHTVMHQIEVHTLLEAECHTTLGDPTQVQNLLLNLALNARDAMPHGGEMSFRTETVRLDETTCGQLLFPLKPGEYIRLSVSDSGMGIAEELRERIFEPFFTTKSRGEGTGMGLAAVYGTMKNLGGGIRVRSEVNRGTSFDLYFPQELGTGKLADKPSPVATPAGKEILLVDDEELVGRSTEELLSQAGYVPHFFNDSTTALAAYRDRHADISLVVMDMIMPGMDGSRLYRAIKEVNPAARFLIISGFSLNSATQILLDEGDAVFLTKPFQSADLIAAVNRILKS